MPGRDLSAELFGPEPAQTAQPSGKDLSADLFGPSTPAQGGFRVLPGSSFPTRQIDLGNGKTSEQRQDGLVWFGPEQGNTGKPGWFNAQGLRGGAAPGQPTSLMDSFANELVTERNKRAALPLLGQIVPGQISGMAKGLVNNIVAPAQLAAHALGSSAVDPIAQGIEETYRKNWQQSPTGEMAGQALPFLMTGGGTGAAQTPGILSSLANVGKAGVTGAAFAPALTPETNLQGSPDFWARKRQEALLGGVLGAAPAVAGELGGAVLSKFRRPLIPEAQAVQDLGEQFGVRTLAPDLAANKPGLAKTAVLAESVPGSGMVAQRVAQQQEARAAADRLLAQHGIEGDIDTTIQQGLKDKFTQVGATKNALYQEVADAAGDRRLWLPKTYEALETATKDAQASGLPESSVQNLVDTLKSRLYAGRDEAGRMMAPAADTTFTGMQKTRSDLGDEITKLYNSNDHKGARILKNVRDALNQDMQEFATKSGDASLADKWQAADKFYKEKYAPLKDSVLKAARESNEGDQIYGKFIQAGKGDRAQNFYNALDEKGRAAVRARMLQDAMKKATEQEGVFSPAKFAQSLEKIKASTGVFFKGKDKFEVDGFTNLMRHIQRAGQINENPPTGVRWLQMALIGETPAAMTAASLGHPGALAAPLATAGIGRATTALFSSPAGKALLLGASELPAGSPQLDALITKQLPKVLGVSASNVTKFQAPAVPLAAQVPQNPTEANMESR